MQGLVIISGIGVREYYEKRGYFLENNYMVKQFTFYKKYNDIIEYISQDHIMSHIILLISSSGILLLTCGILFGLRYFKSI